MIGPIFQNNMKVLPKREIFRNLTNFHNNQQNTTKLLVKKQYAPAENKTPKKIQVVINQSPLKKNIYKYVCINHQEKKAKYFVKDIFVTKYCSACAIKIAPFQNKKLQKIENLDKENLSPREITPFEYDNIDTDTNQENSICRYNSEIQNFMIDLEQVIQTNQNALRDINQENKTMKEVYVSQSQKIDSIYKNALNWIEIQRNNAQKTILEQYTQNKKIFEQIEENISDNQKEAKNIASELTQKMDDFLEKEPQQHLSFQKSRLAYMEDYINKVQNMTFQIDKVRPNALNNVYSQQKEHFYLIKNKNVMMSFDKSHSNHKLNNPEVIETPKKRKISFSPIKTPQKQTIIQPIIQVNTNQQCINVHSPVFKEI